MAAHDLIIGGVSVRYFPGGEAPELEEPVQFLDLPEDVLAGNLLVRRIVFRLLSKSPPVALYLHWSDGTSLTEVDGRVVTGTATDEDFHGAVTGQTLVRRCRECGARFSILYAVEFPGFARDRVRRLQEHDHIAHCPACGTRWTAYVLEIVRRLDG
ncbi:zinc ribbon domain-containing protein [Streptomyces sp. NBRC 109706]|uniref:zinc ribbon domain-containing protein n=1 Tax=Streptomyces sp. NBRC 109706 TaxID=1550035 RepID=UPI0007825B69|nr:zinc ribbon domain-containing protein [Streptomyces sp. NBRC 109706]